MVADEGNKYAEKLPTMELKKKAYDSYCAHIANGYPQKSWYFEEGELSITWMTLENYFKRYPELCVEGQVFDPAKKQVARCKNYVGWFNVAKDSADGTNPKANTASLQMIMRNIHGWDKKQEDTKNVDDPSQLRDAIRYEQEVQREVKKRLAVALHERGISVSGMEDEPPLSDQGQMGESSSISDELGPEEAI